MAATALAFDQFDGLPDGDCDARIREARAKLGRRLVILGHHYQRDEVFRVKVPPAKAGAARVALNRMFEVSP